VDALETSRKYIELLAAEAATVKVTEEQARLIRNNEAMQGAIIFLARTIQTLATDNPSIGGALLLAGVEPLDLASGLVAAIWKAGYSAAEQPEG